MRIGIDARFYGEAGPGRYTKAIVQHLEKVDIKNEYIVFLNQKGFETYTPSNTNFKKVLVNSTWYSFEEQTKFLFAVLKQNLDLYYVPHFNIPVLYPKKLVTAIPDMTMHKHATRFSTTLPTWYFSIKKVIYKIVFWWAVFRSSKVIVPSKVVVDEFKHYIKGIPEDKYILAYEGVDPDFYKKHQNPQEVLDKYGIAKEYILYVGSMYEHKNVQGLIEMYKLLKSKFGYTGKFVIVGKKDEFSRKVYEQVKDQGLDSDILFLSYLLPSAPEEKIVVSDLEITALRQRAQAYVFAAFTEGFSLTALEGMVHGLPAAVSDIPCHREVYGDSVVYFDPYNVEDMAGKVNLLLRDTSLRQQLIARGFERLKMYDWEKTARITLDVFNTTIFKQ